MCQSPRRGHPQCVVTGIAGATYLGDVPQQCVRQDRARFRKGTKRTHAVDWLIDVAASNELCAFGSDITNHHYGAEKLALHVQVPRLHVSILIVVVYRDRCQAGRSGHIHRFVKPDRAAESERNCERWVSGQARHDAGHRLVYINAVGRSHDRFVSSERQPGKPNPRLDVLAVFVIDLFQTGADTQQRRALRIKNNEAVITFRWRHVPFVTQSQVESQTLLESVTILRKEPQRALGDAARLIAERDAKGVRASRQKCRDGGEVERTSRLPEIVVEKLPVLAADAQSMWTKDPIDCVRDYISRIAAA